MNNTKGQKFDLLGVLLLLLAFSAAILSLLLAGAKTYKSLTERDRKTQDLQIASLYLGNRLSQAASPEAVSVEKIGGTDCLLIESEAGGNPYLTRVYCYEGWIREFFSEAGLDFSPGDGEMITEADSLSLREEGGLLIMDLAVEGQKTSLFFSREEGAHE